MADQITVNGALLSWGSLKLDIADEPLVGIDNITYGDKLEVTEYYGMNKSQSAMGRSRGKYSTDETKITGAASTIEYLLKAVAAQSADGKSYGEPLFDLSLMGAEKDSSQTIDVQLEDCKILGVSATYGEGADVLKQELTIKPLRIRRSGLTLYSEA